MKSLYALLCPMLILLAMSGPTASQTVPEKYDRPSPVKIMRADPVQPDPAVAKAVITDLNGLPLPEMIPLGEPIYLSAAKSTAGPLPKSYKWIITPQARAERARSLDGNQTLVVGSGTVPIDMTVTLVVAKGDTVDSNTYTFHLGDVTPLPPTPPTPLPNPNPPTPGPVITTLQTQIQAITAKYQLDAVQKKKIAAAWLSIVPKIQNGSLDTPDALLNATADASINAVSLNAWLSWYRWRDEITALLMTQGYTTIPQHAPFWQTVAAVLNQ